MRRRQSALLVCFPHRYCVQRRALRPPTWGRSAEKTAMKQESLLFSFPGRAFVSESSKTAFQEALCMQLTPKECSDLSCSTDHNLRLPERESSEGEYSAMPAWACIMAVQPGLRAFRDSQLPHHNRRVIAADRREQAPEIHTLLQLFPHRVYPPWSACTHLAGWGK